MAVLNVDIIVNDDGTLAIKKYTDEAKKAESANKSLATSTKGVSSAFSSLGATLGAVSIGLVAREYAKVSDTMTLLEARIKLVTKESANLAKVQEDLFNIAQQNRVAYKNVGELYARIVEPLNKLGYSTQNAINITDAFSKALLISGASVEESNSAIRQFSQAMASGVLRGDEFNSMAENSPRLMKALSDALGVTNGELRQMAQDGKLSADIVAGAIVDSLGKLQDEAKTIPLTIGGAFQTLTNELSLSVKAFNDVTGASQSVADGISSLAGVVKDFTSAMVSADKASKEFYKTHNANYATMDEIALVGGTINEVTKKQTESQIGLNNAIKQTVGSMEDARNAFKRAEKLAYVPYNPSEAQIKEAQEREKKAIAEAEKLQESWAKRKLDISYEISIAEQDALSRPYIELQKSYENDLKEFANIQGAKELLTKEYNAKVEALNKKTIEDFTKLEEDKAKKSAEWQVKLFDANEKLNEQLLAQNERMYGATSEAQIEAWYQNQLEWLGKLALEGKATSEELQGLLSKINDIRELKTREQTLKFKIEKSFYTSFESNLATSIEDAFNGELNLKSFFRNIGSDLLRTISGSASGGIVNTIRSYVGGGSLVGSSVSANDITSLISSGATSSGGNIITSGGTVIDKATGVVTSQGGDALSLLSTASSLKSAYGLLSGGVSGSVLSGFNTIAGGFDALGLSGVGNTIGQFGYGFANPYSATTSYGAIGAGSTVGGMALGGLGGYALGSLGDRLFGADTKAGTFGSIGGAVGSLLGPVGAIGGALLGSILGGFFGSTKQTGAGIDILGNASAENALGQYYQSYKKKSWFSSKSWENTQAFGSEENQAIMQTIGLYDYLLSQLGEYDNLIVQGGRFTSLQNFLDTGVTQSFLKAINPQNLDTIYQTWSDYATSIDKTITEALATAVSGYIQYGRGFTEWKLGKGTVEQLEFTAKNLQDDFTAMANSLSASDVTVENFLAKYDEAIKANFTQDTIEAWASLGDALMSATDAQKAYQEALGKTTKTTYNVLPYDTMLQNLTTNDMGINIKEMVMKQDEQNNQSSQIVSQLYEVIKVLKQQLTIAQFGNNQGLPAEQQTT